MSGTTGPLARDRVVISVMFATVGSVGDICRRVGPTPCSRCSPSR